MTHPLMSHYYAKAFAFALFISGLAVWTVSDLWPPLIFLVFGYPLALHQYLFGRYYDMGVSLVIFTTLFITSVFGPGLFFLLPVVFTTAGIFLLFREWAEEMVLPIDEEEADLNLEIEEEERLAK